MKVKSANKFEYLVVDVSNIAYRQYHALHRLTTSDGRVSGHVYGSIKNLINTVEEFNPKYVVFCYDKGRAYWRNNILRKHPIVGELMEDKDNYKGNRDKSDLVCNPTIDVERALCNISGYHLFHPNYEADDMMAAFVRSNTCQDREGDVLIYSGDKDLWQMVSDKEGIFCLYPYKKKSKTCYDIIDESRVQEEFGVPPKRVPMVKALLGDKSDNIRGLVGASRSGKIKGLTLLANKSKKFFLKKYKTEDLTFPKELPSWLVDELKIQRERLIANYQVASLDFAIKRLKKKNPEGMTVNVCIGKDKNKRMLMDILMEFECSSLLRENTFNQNYALFGVPEGE